MDEKDAKPNILVTGVDQVWGRQVADRLLAEDRWHVIGLATAPPHPDLPKLDFVEAGWHNPAFSDLLISERVRVVCHLGLTYTPHPTAEAFNHNVVGTMQLLSACAQAGVKHIIIPSSTRIYGAHPDNPAFLTETDPLQANRRHGYLRDLLEIETFCQTFQAQTPDTRLTILRFAPLVGSTAEPWMIPLLTERHMLLLLGYDPLWQLLHSADALEAITHALITPVHGTFNIAAPDVMPFSRALVLAGKLPLSGPAPLVTALVSRAMRATCSPVDLDYLRYPCVADTTQMSDRFGFTPAYSAEDTLRAFAKRHLDQADPTPAGETTETSAEKRLRQIIAERRQPQPPTVEEG